MADFQADAELARALLREAQTATLATLCADGWPFASHIAVAAADNNEPLLLLSRLAIHTGNLEADPRASLLLVRSPPEGAERLAAERLTLTGTVRKEENASSREVFLARRPEAVRYAGFADFSMFRFAIRSAHLVGGFGRIAGIPASELIGDMSTSSRP
jgi:putative heme iron utilization protein